MGSGGDGGLGRRPVGGGSGGGLAADIGVAACCVVPRGIRPRERGDLGTPGDAFVGAAASAEVVSNRGVVAVEATDLEAGRPGAVHAAACFRVASAWSRIPRSVRQAFATQPSTSHARCTWPMGSVAYRAIQASWCTV